MPNEKEINSEKIEKKNQTETKKKKKFDIKKLIKVKKENE